MKVVIFTTETLHHTFFVKEMSKVLDNLEVICEIPIDLNSKYNTFHEFEEKREEFEKKIWFDNKSKQLKDYANICKFKSINSPEAYNYIKKNNEGIFIVFGTGIINKKIIDLNNNFFFNLHGGDPVNYRGLDSHLWSIYYKDFISLKTTLHKLDKGIDTGEIVDQENLKLDSNSSLINLRVSNTVICVNLVKKLIDNLKKNKVVFRKQKKIGKYFSAMPSELKEKTLKTFSRYITDRFN